MAWSLVGHPVGSTTTSSTALTVSSAVGATINSGDIITLFYSLNMAGPGNGTVTAPDGTWTSLGSAGFANNLSTFALWKVAGGSEPASYAFTHTGSGTWFHAECELSIWRGSSVSSSVVDASVSATGNSTTPTATGVTTLLANDLVVVNFFFNNQFNYTTPTGMTRADATNAGYQSANGPSSITFFETFAATGATGNFASSMGTATGWDAWTLALKIAVPVSGTPPEVFRRSFSNIQKIAYIRNLLAKPPIP